MTMTDNELFMSNRMEIKVKKKKKLDGGQKNKVTKKVLRLFTEVIRGSQVVWNLLEEPLKAHLIFSNLMFNKMSLMHW